MSEQMVNPSALDNLARQVEETYSEFTQSVRDLGSKTKGHQGGSSKMSGSFLRWIAGSHVSTPRDLLCEQFLEKVQGQLEFFQTAMEGAETSEIQQACCALASVMLDPKPERSNSTTDLMKRAMVSRFQPFLQYLPREAVATYLEQFRRAYKPRDLLPVEKTLMRDMERILSE